MLTDILRDSYAASNERAYFLLHVLPEKLAEYIEVHQRVWPEMLHILSDADWKAIAAVSICLERGKTLALV